MHIYNADTDDIICDQNIITYSHNQKYIHIQLYTLYGMYFILVFYIINSIYT